MLPPINIDLQHLFALLLENYFQCFLMNIFLCYFLTDQKVTKKSSGEINSPRLVIIVSFISARTEFRRQKMAQK